MMYRVSLSCAKSRQSGLSYVEVVLSVVIIAAALVPALQAVQTGIQSAAVHDDLTDAHYHLLSKLQTVQTRPFGELLAAAQASGVHTSASSYSDASGSENRRLVYLSYYDADDSDGDGNPFSISDPNFDADNDPYTSVAPDPGISLLWIRAEIEQSPYSLETLQLR